MAIIGYIRISTNKQTIEHQHFEIEQYAISTLLEELKENDILISCKICCLGCSLLEVMQILETCLSKNNQVWTIKENYRLNNDIPSKVLAYVNMFEFIPNKMHII